MMRYMRSLPASARRAGAAVTGLALAATVTAIAVTPASAERPARAAHTWSVKVHRGGHDAKVVFHRRHPGEVLLDVTVAARGVSWAQRKNESAVVSAYVDGHYVTDIVITSSGPVTRQFALGRLRHGRHVLRLHYADGRSPSKAGVATLRGIRFTTVRPGNPEYAAARYSPVLYGRNVAGLGGRFQNNRTDTPLIAWHRILPAAAPGHSMIEYTVLWSNEDGGTNTPALMAQWGRTTDIEWIYRVEVNAKGVRVPGTGVFQSAGHGTQTFRGRYDGTHPVLQTCTGNNNVCDSKALRTLKERPDPMRFALSTRGVLPADQPREHEMDTHPWTYQVMAREMLREHKIESPSDPASLSVGDQRSYLYVAVTHSTTPAGSAGGVGLALEVRLKGDPTTYSSNHGIAFWTINRDGPAATTVELPVGTNAGDVASISAVRVPIGTDNGATLSVTRINRAFFLGRTYRPRPSFVRWHGNATLTVGSPTAQLWPAT
jgi:hypothetical protein